MRLSLISKIWVKLDIHVGKIGKSRQNAKIMVFSGPIAKNIENHSTMTDIVILECPCNNHVEASTTSWVFGLMALWGYGIFGLMATWGNGYAPLWLHRYMMYFCSIEQQCYLSDLTVTVNCRMYL